MKIVRTLSDMTPSDRQAAAAIGNFDGVHLGHQAVIGAARIQAHSHGAPLGIVTFEPHPRQVLSPDAPPFRLMNAAARAHRLERLGVDVLYELPFNSGLAALTPQDFAAEVLHKGLGLRHAVIGADFRFGRARAGDARMLQNLGAALGFGVTIAPLVEFGAMEVSSTAIRAALTEGRCGDARAMLGHWHRLEGPVLHGDKRGRTLGFPTANMAIAGLHPPRFGVYAVLVDVLDGAHQGTYQGAASIGVRPTFGVNAPNCETFLFDFSGDLYGATLSVALVEFLRPELKFDGLDPLIAQMEADCARARQVLAHV